MSREDYKEDIERARTFIINHNAEIKLTNFMFMIRHEYSFLMHSDRWSMVYDFIDENYPDARCLVTGLTYLLEE